MTGTGLVLHRFDRAVAAAAERAGVAALWVKDGPLEGWALLGALAACTTTVGLGALVSEVADRNPAVIAKQATTIDVISHGRAVLAIGGADAARVEEALDIFRAMFRDEEPTFAGPYHRIERAFNRPAPVQPGGPPVLVAGHPALGVRHADGVVLTCGRSGLLGELAAVARCCGESDRDPASMRTVWWPEAPAVPDAVAEAATVPGLDGTVIDLGSVDGAATAAALRKVLRADR